MSGIETAQFILYFAILILCIQPLGWYMARVYEGEKCGLDLIIGPLERFIYRLGGVDPNNEMDWKAYAKSFLILNFLGILFLYLLLRFQGYLPLNPQSFGSLDPLLSFNTAISYMTNTNWQAYSGESTLSYFAQMSGMTVLNFLSAASGMAVMVALFRALRKNQEKTIGNFWVDCIRSIMYILLPLSLLFALILGSQGVIQNLKPYQQVETLEGKNQIIPMGPVASQIAIKQLGSNGGGYFGTNSAHPFENPTPLSNFVEMLAILLIPAASCFTFGIMIKDKRQGLALLVAMFLILIPAAYLTGIIENTGNPLLNTMEIAADGNMEGKETRFGVMSSALWTSLTTASSNGSVNSSLDSYLPLASVIPLWLMHLGEVIFGGVGSGMYGMLMFAMLAVFASGLMVGRSPEYLGKKVGPYEIKMAAFAILVMPMVVLLFTAIGVLLNNEIQGTSNPGAHGFSQILYAFTSMGNNNGSAFAGLHASKPYYEITGGMIMLINRFWFAIPVLAVAGSMVEKKILPRSLGTLETHTPLFIFILLGTLLIAGALSFFPALALGPLAEHFTLWANHG